MPVPTGENLKIAGNPNEKPSRFPNKQADA
jgi:hypothetical protein